MNKKITFFLIALLVVSQAQAQIYTNNFETAESINNWTLNKVTWDNRNNGQLIFATEGSSAIMPVFPAEMQNTAITITAIWGSYIHLHTSPDGNTYTDQGLFEGNSNVGAASKLIPDGTRYVKLVARTGTNNDVFLISVKVRKAVYINDFATADDVKNWTLDRVAWNSGNDGQLAFATKGSFATIPVLPGGLRDMHITASAIYDSWIYLHTSSDGISYNNQGLIATTSSPTVRTTTKPLPDGTRYVRFVARDGANNDVFLISVIIVADEAGGVVVPPRPPQPPQHPQPEQPEPEPPSQDVIAEEITPEVDEEVYIPGRPRPERRRHWTPREPSWQLSVRTWPSSFGKAAVVGNTRQFKMSQEGCVTATANPGYIFKEWKYRNNSVSNEENYCHPNANRRMSVSLTAHFRQRECGDNVGEINELLKRQIILGVRPNNEYGTVEGAGTYPTGEHVPILAIPKHGYKFVAWKNLDGRVVRREPDSCIVVRSDVRLNAHFEKAYWVLRTVVEPHSNAGRVEGGWGTYQVGVERNVIAMPLHLHRFKEWRNEHGEFISEDFEIKNITGEADDTIRLVAYFELCEILRRLHGRESAVWRYPSGWMVTNPTGVLRTLEKLGLIDMVWTGGYTGEWRDESTKIFRTRITTEGQKYIIPDEEKKGGVFLSDNTVVEYGPATEGETIHIAVFDLHKIREDIQKRILIVDFE